MFLIRRPGEQVKGQFWSFLEQLSWEGFPSFYFGFPLTTIVWLDRPDVPLENLFFYDTSSLEILHTINKCWSSFNKLISPWILVAITQQYVSKKISWILQQNHEDVMEIIAWVWFEFCLCFSLCLIACLFICLLHVLHWTVEVIWSDTVDCNTVTLGY